MEPKETLAQCEFLTLSSDVSQALDALARREEVTVSMAVVAALVILCSRVSGQDDVVLGAAIAHCNRAETDKLSGFSTNALPLRIKVDGEQNLAKLLGQVRNACLEAFSRQDVPFEKVVEQLRPVRDLSYQLLFQVLFDMVQIEAPLELQGFKVEPVFDAERTAAKFDLTLYAPERDGQIVLSLAYSSDLFDAPRIVVRLHQLRHLLAQIVADPERQLGAYTLVAPEHRELLPDLREELDESFLGGVHELFAMYAGQDPSRTAVVDVEGTVSYGELDRRSNRVAHYLAAHGIERGDIVAIYGHRSTALVWALMGVLKAGAAYTILDPAYPCARLVSYLKEADPRGLLQVAAAGELPEELRSYAATIPCRLTLPPFGASRDFLQEYPEHDPGVGVGADDLAFVAFTSGSTGEPKGVLGRHGPLTHFLPFQKEAYGFEQSDRFILLSGLAYNHLQRDVFTPLCIGGRLYIPADADVVLPERIVDWVAEHAITVLNVTPGRGQLLHQATRGRELGSLRLVFFGGDALKWADVKRTFEWAPHATVIARYGATETQRAGAHFIIPRDTPIPEEKLAETVPLGRGIRDAQYLVLNSRGELAGIGELGELCIRSPHLAQGYLNDESLTQARFVPNPHTGLPQDRWYRTGEYARYLPDGNVQFVSRDESRVNIRGFRVELGEIESWLERAQGVAQAVVVAHDFGTTPETNDLRLVAYVVEENGAGVSPQEVRAFLKDHLPDYMVPSYVEMLETLPLTPNGKVDRAALPDPEAKRSVPDEAYVPARTELEELLVGIWVKVLGVDGVGIHDNFFDLGGHSLLATQVISRVNAAFDVTLPLRDLFEAPTIAGLSRQIAARRGTRTNFEAPPLAAVARDRELRLSFSQEREWFLDRLEPGTSAYNVDHALRIRGQLSPYALSKSLTAIVERHESLRTIFPSRNGQPIQVILEATDVALPVVDLSALSEPAREIEMQRLVRAEARTPFDLSLGPLLRCLLVDLGGEEAVLCVTIHHIVFDGWSSQVFARELWTLYQGFEQCRGVPLPELRLQYADYAQWQRHSLSGQKLEELLSYWRGQLQDSPALLELPTDRPRPRMQTFNGAAVPVSLPRQLAEELNQFCRTEAATPFMALLSGFTLLLYSLTAQERINVGTFIANRNLAEIEPLIGFFVNTLVLSTNMSGNPNFRELLRRVRTVTLDAYAHQDLPFEKLLEELKPARKPSYTPLFQVMFVMQNMPKALLPSGLDLTPLPQTVERANFDLTLWMWPGSEGLNGSLHYNTDLFAVERIQALVEQYRILVEQVLKDPERPIAEIPVVERLLSVHTDPFSV